MNKFVAALYLSAASSYSRNNHASNLLFSNKKETKTISKPLAAKFEMKMFKAFFSDKITPSQTSMFI